MRNEILNAICYHFSISYEDGGVPQGYIELADSIAELFSMKKIEIKPLKLDNTDLLIIKCEEKPTNSQVFMIEESLALLKIPAIIVRKTDEFSAIPERELLRIGFIKKDQYDDLNNKYTELEKKCKALEKNTK